MIPLYGLLPEDQSYEKGEYGQGYNFLNYLELHQGEGTAVSCKTYSVGRHLTAVFEQGYAPGKQNDSNQGPAVADMHL